jgi:hypothetical protein
VFSKTIFFFFHGFLRGFAVENWRVVHWWLFGMRSRPGFGTAVSLRQIVVVMGVIVLVGVGFFLGRWNPSVKEISVVESSSSHSGTPSSSSRDHDFEIRIARLEKQLMQRLVPVHVSRPVLVFLFVFHFIALGGAHASGCCNKV